jgi:uncharacterized protein
MFRFAAAIIALVALCSPRTADAQSYNCRYARTADEILICQDGRLSQLDERMAAMYAQVRNRMDGYERQQLEAQQRFWLQGRQRCGRDYACIESYYLVRISELASY